MNDAVQVLWFETWWTWSRPETEPYLWSEIAGHYFNYVEALAWFLFAGFVFFRWLRHRHSFVEILYALGFVTFGISDWIESERLTSWLLWWKGANLGMLLWLRHTIKSKWYPTAKIF